MKNLIIGLLVLFVVRLGIYSISHKKLGDGTVTNYPTWYYNGLSGGNASSNGYSGTAFVVSSTGTLSTLKFSSSTIGISSSSPAALGTSIAGHFIVATGASTAQASTTAVTANSTIILEQELTTPIPGTTCNTVIASDTVVSTKVPGIGFTVTNSYTPATNPQCEEYFIIN